MLVSSRRLFVSFYVIGCTCLEAFHSQKKCLQNRTTEEIVKAILVINVNPKPNLSLWPVIKNTYNPMNQLNLSQIRHEVREKVCERGTTGTV